MKHGNADGLSRKPCKQCTNCDRVNGKDGDEVGRDPLVLRKGGDPVVRVAVLEPSLDSISLREAQLADASLSWVLAAKSEGNERPLWSDISSFSADSKTFWSYWEQLSARNGVLYRKWESDDGGTIRWRLVVPLKYREKFIQDLHGGKLGAILA